MATFETALQKVLKNEGGYVNDPDDPGGETYKGVARKVFSKWDGWEIIDSMKHEGTFPANLDKNDSLQEMISDFYRINFWNKVKGDDITNENVAFAIFDFGVNAGVKTSVSIAQKVVDAKADGIFGSQTLKLINGHDPEMFLASFTLAKIARYISIVQKRPSSKKYFYGWVCRALNSSVN
jgi:lysozyme family protein